MRRNSIAIILMICLVHGLVFAQTKYPKNYFRSPVDFQILLAGSFGEVRKNHFHSGIDIRTEGVTGKPVRAVADGYISRVNVSPVGFGKALYITHPNGYTSVYGHLQGFNSLIGGWVKAQQYKQESFEADIAVQPGVLSVKKGDIIAYSGNSGSSGGPHLHFELRDAATQETINPLLFGLPVRDLIPPRIYSIKIYPYGENSLVNLAGNPLFLNVSGSDGNYFINAKDTIKVSGNIFFGIQAFDFMNDSGMKNGVTIIELRIDTALCFYQHLERFAFSETRYVNSVIDYPAFIRSDQKIQRSFIAPNNKLSIFGKAAQKGVVNFSDSKPHKVEYVVKDIFGNTSRCSFWVKSHPPIPAGRYKEKIAEGTLFSCKSVNKFSNSDLLLELPQDALYEDLDFHYSSSAPVKGSYSKVHHLQDEYTPIQSLCTLSIKAKGLPEKLRSKALIVKVAENGKFSARAGKWEDGHVITQIREFGDYTISVDTIPPVIRAVNILPGKKLTKQKTIAMKISDDLSGVKTYRGTLNGKWILMDYDAKSQLLTYQFDERLQAGKNDFKLVVKDGVGNETVYEARLNK
jgi:hypothetical protein